MANCLTISQQIASKCRNSTPGVSTILLANYASLYPTGGTTGYGFTLNSTSDKIIGITGVTEAGYSSGFFYEIKINRENASFIDPVEISIPNGTKSFKPKLDFKVTSLDTTTRTLFKQLSEATVIAIVKDNEGNYYLLGRTNGLDMISGSQAETGAASGDMKGLTINLEGWENEPFIEIDTTQVTISSLIVTT